MRETWRRLAVGVREREREEGGGRILKQNDGGWVLTTPVGEKREGG